jgi:gamma-glutamylcyclotransferase (GGCT)/AIG2-like uncharacterized protein YtfP
MPKYFAYGSNMARRLMAETCADHRVLGPARLDGYRLAFTRRSIKTGTGVANVVADPSAAVWGALYEISEDCAAQLDRKEGHPWAYARTGVSVHLNGGTREAAFTYVVSEPEDDDIPPSEPYLESIIEGARDHSLPTDYVAWLASLRGRWSDSSPG